MGKEDNVHFIVGHAVPAPGTKWYPTVLEDATVIRARAQLLVLQARVCKDLEAALLDLHGARRTFRSRQVARAIARLEALFRDVGGVPPAQKPK